MHLSADTSIIINQHVVGIGFFMVQKRKKSAANDFAEIRTFFIPTFGQGI